MRFALLASAAALCFVANPTLAEEAPAPHSGHHAEHNASDATAHAMAHRGRLEADVRFLAGDALDGREAGTNGYALAAGYVAGQYAAIGLQPAGNDATYFQAVPMLSAVSVFGDRASLVVTDSTGAPALPAGTPGEDYFTFPKRGAALGESEGELVFVGQAFASEGYEQDDFAGLDLTGKIAVRLRGAPRSLNSEERAHFGVTASQRLSERGAIGSILVLTPTDTDRFPYEQLKHAYSEASLYWADENGEAFNKAPNVQTFAVLSPEQSEALFKGQQISWEDVTNYAAGERDNLPSFEMGLSASTLAQSTIETTSSRNIIGMVPGTDPAVANEFVVVSAHLDSTANPKTPEEGDDEIANGAMDNATGIASMIEAARMLRENPGRRPVVFLAVTAEEQGLVGSDYFARNPTLGDGEIVANINLDMPILTYEFTDVTAFGAERSTLLREVEAAAAIHGITLRPDPVPEQGLFTRSDQYRFVEQGIPAIFLVTGWGNGGEAAQQEFLTTHYHQVSDEVSLIDFEQLGRFTDVNFSIIQNVANMAEKPVWKAGDFFAKTFGGEIEQ